MPYQRLEAKTPYLFGIFFLCTLVLAGCGGNDGSPPVASITPGAEQTPPVSEPDTSFVGTETLPLLSEDPVPETPPVPSRHNDDEVEVIIDTTLGSFRVKLDPKKAPLTVDNFLTNYVDRDFYVGTIFHFVDPNFMIAGGGFTSDLKAKETNCYVRNEADNGLKNVRGTIAMTRDPEYVDSATSQFFINLADNTALDHTDPESPQGFGYCVFGQVIEGMETVDRIAQVAVADKGQFPSTPVEPVVMKSIRRAP
jgi:peptidyl-prolyl cis-trans isomerase A (cyclophilin A)